MEGVGPAAAAASTTMAVGSILANVGMCFVYHLHIENDLHVSFTYGAVTYVIYK